MACFSCIDPRGLRNPRRRRNPAGESSTFSNRSRSGSISGLIHSLEREKKINPDLGECQMNKANNIPLKDLAAATRNFRMSNLIGEGGFGRVFKGSLANQVVAIKQLKKDGLQGNEEFLVEVLMLIMLHHPNLVRLIGFCAEKEERLLVYEYMPNGSLEDHLFELRDDQASLDWNTRVKIALGAAKGLAYLHNVANPPVIYRDLKAANILLDEDFNPKLSDFGLAKIAPTGDKTHVSTRVMGTYGYCAPDYAVSGKLTLKSDVYSFGVVLLELITGRRAFDFSQESGSQSLTAWSRPYFTDKKRFTLLADPLLRGRYPLRAFYRFVTITSLCLQENPDFRPLMHEVVSAIDYVATESLGINVEGKMLPPLPSPLPKGEPTVPRHGYTSI